MISTHILDTTSGKPAGGVSVSLALETKSGWTELSKQLTNQDGRASFDVHYEAGTYRLIFGIEAYFKSQQVQHFFLDTPVIFRVVDTNRKYHVPLLLNPFGYSTYRGS